MLRVTIFDSPREQRLVLEGRLTEPWLAELELAWKQTQTVRQGRKCVVDLTGATLIDEHGKRILIAMCNEGVQFIAHGVATIHLIKEIRRKCWRQQASERC